MPELERRPSFVESELFDRVIEGVRNGKYHLVLGAGASYGCRNPAGDLPMAPALEEILLDAINVKPSVGVGLPRAFESAAATLGPAAVTDVLRNRFADAEPLDWHKLIPTLPWEAVWSFNVDDVIERAYQETPDRKQLPIVRLPNDDQLPYGGAHEQTPLVHLHGYVGSIDQRDDPQLVFDWQQYLSAVREADRANWQGRFRGDYQVKPVIVLGARLNEELDILEVLRRGNHSSHFGYPSLIIRPNISDFDNQEYERWGLTAVDASAEEFFRYLKDAVEATLPAAVEGEYTTLYTDRTFLRLPAQPFERPPGHDFYGGHAPEWADVLEVLDAMPAWLQSMVDELGIPSEAREVQLLYLIKGPPFSGKSTALLQLARELRNRGWEPVLLVGRERIEYEAALAYFDTRPRAILLIDGLALDAGDVGELLRRAEHAGQRLVVVAADRERHTSHIANVVSPKHLVGVETTLFIEPTNSLWIDILGRRSEHARLGRLEGSTQRDQQLHFVEHGRELFSALASLEDASGFIDRGLEVYRDLPAGMQAAFATVALLSRFGLPAPVSSVSAASGVTVRTFLEAMRPGAGLAQWIIADPFEVGYVKLRHRYLGDLLLTGFAEPHHQTPMSEVAQSICLSLADQLSPTAIRRKTVPHRIVASLMDLQTVQLLCRTQDVDDWYERMEPVYSWNARYWEQRALGLPNAPERAYSYAKRAARLHSDAFTLNTLGTILMRRAVEEPSGLGPAQRKQYWRDGVEALVRSRDLGAGRFEHPFVTFFSYTLRLLAIEPDMDREWFIQAEQAFRDWRAEAARLSFFDSSQMRRIVGDFPAEWRR